MKLCRITVGTKHCDGRREASNIESGFYYISMDTSSENYESTRRKKEKMLSNATHFIVYWGKKCAIPLNRGKFIGIYKNDGFFSINNMNENRLFNHNNNKYMINKNDKIDENICLIGVYLKKIYEGELHLPNKPAVIGDFGNIINPDNVRYIEHKLIQIII